MLVQSSRGKTFSHRNPKRTPWIISQGCICCDQFKRISREVRTYLLTYWGGKPSPTSSIKLDSKVELNWEPGHLWPWYRLRVRSTLLRWCLLVLVGHLISVTLPRRTISLVDVDPRRIRRVAGHVLRESAWGPLRAVPGVRDGGF